MNLREKAKVIGEQESKEQKFKSRARLFFMAFRLSQEFFFSI
jgi:hypothetical protein